MSLTQKQIQYLKEKAHSLSPVVTIGQKGITESLIKELDSSIENHELLKVKILGGDRDSRTAAAEELSRATSSETIQIVGNVITLFRRRRTRSSPCRRTNKQLVRKPNQACFPQARNANARDIPGILISVP